MLLSSAAERHARARRGRGLQPPEPEPDGMASALLRLPAEDMAAFFTAVDAAAGHIKTTDPDDPRTLEQVRADILATWAGPPSRLGTSAAATRPAAIRARRWARSTAGSHTSVSPCRSPRCSASKTNPRTCPGTGQSRPTESCDVDHTTPAGDGGPTSPANNEPLHRPHHVDKTHHGWRLIQPEPGRFVWTSPTGHTDEVDLEIIGPLVAADWPPGPEPPPEVDPDPPPF